MASSRASASARLRKTFKYPSEDEDSSGSREEMDEEEQTKLISNLKSQDDASNQIYTLIFSLLPLLTLPPFLYYLFASSSPGTARLLCLLGITSLLASAFTMKFIPVSPLSVVTSSSSTGSSSSSGSRQGPRGIGRPPPLNLTQPYTQQLLPEWFPFDITMDLDPSGPLLKFLPWLNVGICALLCLAAFTFKGKQDSPESLWLFLLLPALVLAVLTVVRHSMKQLEEGIENLEGMKYDYKGA